MRNSKEVIPQSDGTKADLSKVDGPPLAEGCEWTPDSDDTWNTGCRKYFTFSDGGIADNRFEFCPFCGGAIFILNEGDS